MIKRVVIAGGGTAGWVTAAALSLQLGDLLQIVLIESDEIGTVGVGEASIPPMRTFHKLLKIDEREFMAATSATFKLGISFENWGKIGDKYLHAFGKTGKETWLAEFHHFWLSAKEKGFAGNFGDYCLEHTAAIANKFATTPDGAVNYAYHLDAGRYATFLRRLSEEKGVRRIEGKIAKVKQNSTTGFIESIDLESGQVIEGDLFIDCTGFRGVLIEQTLHTGYEDWTHWLPCDSAAAVQTESVGPAVPYTRSISRDYGWQWRIPLQHRVGNGLVYCSRYMTDEAAKEFLLQNVEGEPLSQPRIIKFRTGRRRKIWNKNCVAIGLSSGFLEPLESTSIHLIMMGVTRLMQMFPFTGISETVVSHYNQMAYEELEKIRDFIILHYKATSREDTPFWRFCKNMEIPDSLHQRIELFAEEAQAFQLGGEIFRVDSWVQVMLGQGIIPKSYHPYVRLMPETQLRDFLRQLKNQVAQMVGKLPEHETFVRSYCPSAVNT